MGGDVGLTIRESNGTVHKMCRWTNALPWMFKNIALLSEDPKHISDILASWYEMKKDYQKNKATKKFKFPMSEFYVPQAALCPISYGLVVLDLKTKTILDMQGYTRLHSIDIHNPVLCIENNKIPSRPSDEDDYSSFWALVDLIRAGKISHLNYYDSKKGQMLKRPFPTKLATELATERKLADFLIEETNFKSRKNKKNKNNGFGIDMSPFKYFNFEESNMGSLSMMKALSSLGFKLNAKEIKNFKTWRDEDEE